MSAMMKLLMNECCVCSMTTRMCGLPLLTIDVAELPRTDVPQTTALGHFGERLLHESRDAAEMLEGRVGL